MLRLLTLLSLTALAAGAAEVYPAVDAGGTNLFKNADFEQRDGDQLAGWGGYGEGYEAAPGAGREGSTAAVCARPTPDSPARGVSQRLELNQQVAAPVVVTGWSKAEGVSGHGDTDYSLYCDLEYTDGTPLWGQLATFGAGTHDWVKRRVVIVPVKPIRFVVVYGLFRNHTGTAWFDDFGASELSTPAGGALLDSVPVTTQPSSAGPAQMLRAGGLTLGLAGSRVTAVKLGDTPVTADVPAGFLVRDVAAGAGFHDFQDGRCEALGLQLDATVKPVGDHFEVEGTMTDLRAQPRALTLLFALPVEATGWRWGNDAREERAIAPPGEYRNLLGIETGSNQQLSPYPLANIAGEAGGLCLGLDMRRPAQYRLGYSASARLLYLSYDFGLSPAVKRSPSAASFRFYIFDSDGAWGFRAALQRYYAICPDSFKLRTPQQGIWMAFAPTSKVEGWEDFGFLFKEGNDETAWDDQHGILTFRYAEMGTFWMPMPKDLPRTTEAALGLLNKLAADPAAPRRRWAQATIASAIRDSESRLQPQIVAAPWCDGALFLMSPSPHLPGEVNAASLHWGPAQQKAYDAGAQPELDGEYLDSLEGFAVVDPSPAHLAEAVVPPTFSADTLQPVVHTGFTKAEYVQPLADWLHERGRLLMANAVPRRFGFLCADLDLFGTETNWLPGEYRPQTDAQLNLCRALAFKRPYLLLQNTKFDEFGPYVERYFQRAMAYGMFPSMFSHNAANDHYFSTPKWYNRDRELFKRYIPQIRALAEEGWEPVTLARCDSASIQLERFGPGPTKSVYLTLHNPTEQPQTGTVTFEAALGQPGPRTVTLQPYATEVWKLR